MTSLPSLEDVLKIGSAPLQFDPKEPIYARKADGLYCVVKGVVRVFRTTEEGAHAHVDFYRDPHFFGLSCLENPAKPICETAVAHSVVIVHAWPAEQLRGLLASERALGLALMAEAVAQGARFHERLVHGRSRITMRLRWALADLAERIGAPSGKNGEVWIEHGITHAVLAEVIGTSRELTTCHLGELRREGAVDFSRRALVIRPDRLMIGARGKKAAA